MENTTIIVSEIGLPRHVRIGITSSVIWFVKSFARM